MTVAQLIEVLAEQPHDMDVLLCVEDVPYLPIERTTVDDHMGGGPAVLLLVADMRYA